MVMTLYAVFVSEHNRMRHQQRRAMRSLHPRCTLPVQHSMYELRRLLHCKLVSSMRGEEAELASVLLYYWDYSLVQQQERASIGIPKAIEPWHVL